MAKSFDTDDATVLTLLNIFRSLEIFKQFSSHSKCLLENEGTKEKLCSFCLLRSLILKISGAKGRRTIKPNEFVAAFEDLDSDSCIEDLESIN